MKARIINHQMVELVPENDADNALLKLWADKLPQMRPTFSSDNRQPVKCITFVFSEGTTVCPHGIPYVHKCDWCAREGYQPQK